MNIMYRYTWRILKKHKTRTFVTILGVILAVAFLTIITISMKSFERYYLDLTLMDVGAWEVEIHEIPVQDADVIRQDSKVKEVVQVNHYGFSDSLKKIGVIKENIEQTAREDYLGIEKDGSERITFEDNTVPMGNVQVVFDNYLPDFYLAIGGLQAQSFEPHIVLAEGRYPQTSQEIILPQASNLFFSGFLEYEVSLNQSFELDIGSDLKRIPLEEAAAVVEGSSAVIVGVEQARKEKFTVVGFYDVEKSFDMYSVIGEAKNTEGLPWLNIVALTLEDTTKKTEKILHSSLALNLKEPRKALFWVEEVIKDLPSIVFENRLKTTNTSMAELKKIEEKPLGYLQNMLFYKLNINYKNLVRKGAYDVHTPHLPVDALQELSSYSSTKLFLQLVFILITLVSILGSVALIFNAFSISIVERSRELGLLASIGASRFQILKSLLFEAGVMSMTAIPVGIALGWIISYGFLALLNYFIVQLTMISDIYMASIQYSTTALEVVISLETLLGILGLSLATIFLSIFSPTMGMLRLTILQTLKQNSLGVADQRKLKKTKWKGGNFNLKLAWKNYHRNRKQYKSTVFSLTMCVVLFMLVQTFLVYFVAAFTASTIVPIYDYHTSYNGIIEYPWGNFLHYTKLRQIMLEQEGIESIDVAANERWRLKISRDKVSENLLTTMEEMKQDKDLSLEPEIQLEEDFLWITADFTYVEDQVYQEIVKRTGDTETVFDLEAENSSGEKQSFRGLVDDSISFYTDKSIGYYSYSIFNLPQAMDVEGKSILEYTTEPAMEEEEVEAITSKFKGTFHFLEKSDSKAWGYRSQAGPDTRMHVLVPFSALMKLQNKNIDDFLSTGYHEISFFYKVSDVILAQNSIFQIHSKMLLGHSASNLQTEQMSVAIAIKIINLVAYSFVFLTSLIAGANVFNTVSTNMRLRRREFAVYKSIGLDDKNLRKVNYYECFIFGCKALFYGFLISALVNVGFKFIFSFVVKNIGFQVPWMGIGGASITVLVVVLIAMVYSNQKLAQENIIDILKQESF